MAHSLTLLNLISAVVSMGAIAINLVAITQSLSGRFNSRLVIAGISGGWVGVAMLVAASGRLGYSPDSPTPLIGVLFAIPLVTVGLMALASAKVRAALLGVPMHLLVGLNAMRVLGGLFLLDFIAGTLSGPFPFFAGLGDVITGVAAIPLALRMARPNGPSARAIVGWNALGMLDLIMAVTLGITSAAGPLQLIHAGVGSLAMQYLPLSLVPTVLVPFYLLTHALLFAQLRASQRSMTPVSTSISGSSSIRDKMGVARQG